MHLRRKSIICIVALLFAVSLMAVGSSAYAGSTSPVVETKWVADNLGKVKVVFVDNWPSDKEEYMKKHVKGSVYMGIGALMGSLTANPPAKDKFEGMMTSLGINNGDHVVLYGLSGDRVFTLGALWLMDYFGHKNVSLLNGGLAKWNKENLPSEGGMKQASPGKYKAASGDESIRIVADGVLKNLNNSGAVLVDARGTDEYTGAKNEGDNKRLGHIPGAIDLGFSANFNSDGTVKSAADLKALYESKGVTSDKEIIIYCQGGIKAANAYFTLKHILGYPNVKNYVGSWGEWSSRLDYGKYPIEGRIVEAKK